MNIIDTREIESLHISPSMCVKWADEGLRLKKRSIMPPKTAIHMPGCLDFFMTMPCLLPPEYGRFGCKNASRFSCSHPSVKSYMMLCDSNNGDFLSLINCDWITSWRTGATAALAILTFRKSDAHIYSFMGLGRAGKAALECFLDVTRDEVKTIRLLRYKNHAEETINDVASRYDNVKFEICDTITELVVGADVVVSAITQAPSLLVEDVTLFKSGILLVPIHTRGFQNCDKIFDKIFGDDTGQISGFKFFNEFRSFEEFSNVLTGDAKGRENDEERIIAYNIGLGLHDVYFAYKIESLMSQRITPPLIAARPRS
ncbi:MAG: ornithine cyclodeaminase [Paramuribaculum sp.]|nr:ornithine cyclodeaminase [Paramuribaculum sp.]